MSKIRSKYIETSDPFDFSGNVTVILPTTSTQAANKEYVDDQIDLVSVFRNEELAYTNTTNKVIQLPAQVADINEVTVLIIGGSALDYGTDFTIRNVGSTSYVCISPDSTPPSGSFDGGDISNPTIGIESTLLENDLVKVLYSTIGLGGGGTIEGFQGPRGFQGASGGGGGGGGSQGFQGANGSNGTQGATGSTGNTGVQGFTGAGFQGTTGATGSGVQGLTGSNGSAGLQGATGTNGSNGFQGAVGATGSGVQGATGSVGPQGTTGSTGSGIQGATGSTGSTGVQGFTGTNGTNGFQGTTGSTGNTGVQGLTGSNGTNGFQGSTGSTGSTGVQGFTGSNGINGFQGTTGTTGTTGSAGVQGFTGTNGANGFQGALGSTGSAGVQGFTGTTGSTGVQGLTGSTGIQGLTGSVGAQGPQNTNAFFKNEELTYSDTTNKVIATTYLVDNYSNAAAFIVNGFTMDYGIDYTIRNVGSTSYICIDPSSTPPTGSFDGGDPSNPSTGITGFFQSGDTIKIFYSTTGLSALAGTVQVNEVDGVQGSGSNSNGFPLVLGGGLGTGAGGAGTAGLVTIKYPRRGSSGNTLQSYSSESCVPTTNYYSGHSSPLTYAANTIGAGTEVDLVTFGGSNGGTSFISAGTMETQTSYNLDFHGVLTTSGSPDTFRLRVRCGNLGFPVTGGVVVADTGTFVPDANLTARYWRLEVTVCVQSIGSSATTVASGIFTLAGSGLATPKIIGFTTTATIDTTITNQLAPTITFTSGTSGNSITSNNASITRQK